MHDEHDIATSHAWTSAREGCQRGHRDKFGGWRWRTGVRPVSRSGPYGKYRVDDLRRDVRDIGRCDFGHDVDNNKRDGGALEPHVDCDVDHLEVHRVDCGGHPHRSRYDCFGRYERRQLVLVEQTRRTTQTDAATRAGLGVADWTALGSSARLLVTDPAALAPARTVVERQLAAIDLAASRFRSDSELTRLNLAAGDWVAVSPLFAQSLRVARDAAEWSGGLVDPTVGAALIDLGYDRTFTHVAADGPPLTLFGRAAPGWRQLEVDDEGFRARVPHGVRLDLGATAKALAADLSATAVAAAVGCGVLVSLGGDIAVAGEAPAGGWPIEVTDRSDPELPTGGAGQVVAIRDGGVATSSTRARRWRRGGSELHHLIDPRNGLPAAAPWRTVSVAAPTCVLANVASTAAMIIGTSAAGWLSSRDFSARLVAVDGTAAYVGRWPTGGERL